ncbi:16S rRNA (adenine(1518)-N(6)/adenine(1519)-N(6))-dimethyltransferase RsmA [Convivina praedatoris]|uniref:Ribosomal RNA small subunit methyltransferase A n=1 Tax=Convivina praedatoris TaxID=2880963 RepID=A0ABN8H9V5_9LACO|nr:16S rRNA (adenine(1518)-N(6)/adenine(1519)-N(6))-dimethyltransferase RsmA [Convivina sp. LMG 32447]CAH1850579.1 Ribosomal RNA small subunit methyltransferase A [Convivina sp. LMG 32447]CAH1850591.1 Ribosomal RNA small subunit methyltransferase A [Convivina sp. LMG 32447]CAH1850622.1 Ribosomal RNA small subunit methyltransferase A [Convivina sp. LMG 32447]
MVEPLDIATPTRTQAILTSYGLRAKKKFGQNFLTDLNIIDRIIDTADLSDDDYVIEIGPGIGGLTEQLARQAKAVLAVEIDPEMVRVLNDTLSPYDNITVIETDVLTVDLKNTIQKQWGQVPAVKIVANLPYYITTPILMQLLQAGLSWDTMVVMMQREVADRLTAPVGTKEYGVLTVMMAYYAQVQLAVKVPATAFNPAPRVDSAVVRLQPKNHPYQVQQPKELFNLVKICFAHRRKSLWNNLLQAFGKDAEVKEKLTSALAEATIEPGIRAERLDLENFYQLFLALKAQNIKFRS